MNKTPNLFFQSYLIFKPIFGHFVFNFLFDSAQVSSQIVSTKSSDYVLVGSLYPSPEEEGLDAPTPITILHKFEYGFPDEWQALITHWRTYNQKEKYDFINK